VIGDCEAPETCSNGQADICVCEVVAVGGVAVGGETAFKYCGCKTVGEGSPPSVSFLLFSWVNGGAGQRAEGGGLGDGGGRRRVPLLSERERG